MKPAFNVEEKGRDSEPGALKGPDCVYQGDCCVK